MQVETLNRTVRDLMQPAELLAREDSLDRAAEALRRATGAFVPVLDGERLMGAVTDARLAECLANGFRSTDPVEKAIETRIETIPPYATGAEALRKLIDSGAPALAVVDDAGRVMGLVEASDLYPRKPFQPALSPVGGMATPFGVHLSAGVVSAGVPHYALIATGVLLCSLFVVSILITEGVREWMTAAHFSWRVTSWVNGGLPFLLFLGGMRLLPISGIHGAEHKVVHAIERGELLTKDVVRRMPRVHPRCGTNLAVGATLFLGLATSRWADEEVRLLVAVIVTLFLWQRLGSLLQRFVTTKEPTDRQLQMGIRAGRQLLEEYSRARTWMPGVWQRIWHSGMVHVLLGSTTTYLLAWAIFTLFGAARLL